MKKYVLIFVILLACFAGLNCGAESKCDASELLDFKPEHVYLEQGQTVIEGTFRNRWDVGARVKKIKLGIGANDMAGNHLRDALGEFSNLNVWVPANGNTSCRFIIPDSAAQEYDGEWRWFAHYEILEVDYDKPAVTPITSTAGKPAANSGQPQKPTDNRITINQLDLDGEYEVVEVGTHPDYGDIWAETLGAKVKFFRYSDVYRRDAKDFVEDFAKFFDEENYLVATVISSPSGSTHFTHKENSVVDCDWLLRTRGYGEVGRNRFKYTSCQLYKWYKEYNAAEGINDPTDWGLSIDGDYVYVWKLTDGGNSGIVSRGRTDMVLKRIK